MLILVDVAPALFHFHHAAFCVVLWDKNAASHQSANQVHHGEIILAAELFEADDAVDGDSVLEQDDSREHLDHKLFHEEWALFCVNSDEASLQVHFADLVQVHVHDFASLKVLVEEGANDIVSLRDCLQELLLSDLSVGSMAHGDVGSLFRVVSPCGAKALCCHGAHNALILLVHGEVGVLLFLRAFDITMSNVGLVHAVRFDLCLLGCDHFTLHLGGFVGNGLFEDHVSEKVTSELVICCHFCHRYCLCFWKSLRFEF